MAAPHLFLLLWYTPQSSVIPGMSAPHLFLLLWYATELSIPGDVGTTPVFVVVIPHRAQCSRGCRHHTCFCCCDTPQSSVFPGMSAPHLFLLLWYATELSIPGDVGTTPVFVVVIRHRAQFSRGCRHHTCFCCCDTPQSSPVFVFPGMSAPHLFLLLWYATELSVPGDVGTTPVFVVVIRHRAQCSRGCRHHTCFCCSDTPQSSLVPGMSAPHLFLLLWYATELSIPEDVGTTPVLLLWYATELSIPGDVGTTHVFVVHTCFCCCDMPQSSVFPGMSTPCHFSFLHCIGLHSVPFSRSFCVKRKYSMAYSVCYFLSFELRYLAAKQRDNNLP